MRKVTQSEGPYPTTEHTNSLHAGTHVLMKRQMSECILASRAKKLSFDSIPLRRIFKYMNKNLVFKYLV